MPADLGFIHGELAKSLALRLARGGHVKQAELFGLVLVLTACLAIAGPEVNTGTWTSDDAIKTNYWKESFIGGGPGQASNQLTAIGTGFHFTRAALESVECTQHPDGYLACTTTYVGGRLFLNAGGPWLKSGNITVKDITATNKSKSYSNGALDFELKFTAPFEVDGVAYTVSVTATWGPGIPETRVEKKKVVIQRGSDYECSITIASAPPTN